MSDFKAKMHQKALKSTKFDFGWGFAPLDPGPRWRSLHCSSRPLAGFKGPTSKGREIREGGEGGEGSDKEKGKGLEGKAFPLL